MTVLEPVGRFLRKFGKSRLSVEGDGGNGKGQLGHSGLFVDSVAATKGARRVATAIIGLLFILCYFHPQVEVVSIRLREH